MAGDTPLMEAVRAYLSDRRSLGYKLILHEHELLSFARFAARVGHTGPITTDLALRWARLPVQAGPAYWAQRLSIVRSFAKYQASIAPGTEIPEVRLLGPRYHRPTPHIYSSDELQSLLREARRLEPRTGLRPHTYETLFSLLMCTGLRISEALKLRRTEVDLDAEAIWVVESKCRKSRCLPIHRTTARALVVYQSRRNERLPWANDTHIFMTERGTPLTWRRVNRTFRDIRSRLGWTIAPWPRIHDLRHTFAVRTLLRWYAEDAPMNNKIAYLATYLGHADASDTYWYLSAVPELLRIAAQRFERFADPQGTKGE